MSWKTIDNQVKFKSTKEFTEIEISPLRDSKKLLLLKLWVFGWSICGIVVFAQLFLSYPVKEKLFLVIYLALWAYFEFKTIYALRWNLYGKEKIEVKEGKLIYNKIIGERGIPEQFEIAEIKNMHYVEDSKKGFLNDINQSFWMVSGETIQFEILGRLKRIGLKLPKSSANKVIQLINKNK